jgi:DNA-binding XRE family transcriptional regulator
VKPYRSLMQKRLGRPFLDDEVVHHVDGDRSNNDEHNLSIMTRRAHARERKLAIAAKKLEAREAAEKLAAKAKAAVEQAARQTLTRPIDLALLNDHSRPWYRFSGAGIRTFREELGWSQKELAQCAGVSAQTIVRYESRPTEALGSTRVQARLQLVFEQGGIEFLRAGQRPNGGPGIRRRPMT